MHNAAPPNHVLLSHSQAATTTPTATTGQSHPYLRAQPHRS
jgi:hypothetical protein